MSRIRPIILAGGPGARLWPASDAEHPKPFLKLDGKHTLIGYTLDRLKAILADLEATGTEPAGSDDDLISALERMAEGSPEPAAAAPPPPPEPVLPDPVVRELKIGRASCRERV